MWKVEGKGLDCVQIPRRGKIMFSVAHRVSVVEKSQIENQSFWLRITLNSLPYKFSDPQQILNLFFACDSSQH
jgi:hypothetical protein